MEKIFQVVQLLYGIEDTLKLFVLVIWDSIEEVDVVAYEGVPPHAEHLGLTVPGNLVEERHVGDIAPVLAILVYGVSVKVGKAEGSPLVSLYHGLEKVATYIVLEPAVERKVIRYKHEWYKVSIHGTVDHSNLFGGDEIHLFHYFPGVVILDQNVGRQLYYEDSDTHHNNEDSIKMCLE